MGVIRCSLAATCGGSCRDARLAAGIAGRRAVARLLPAARPLAMELRRRPGRPPLVVLQGAPVADDGAACTVLAERRDGSAGGAGAPRVSLTHTHDGAAAAAVGPGWRVGVDMELAGSVGAAETRFFLTARERRQLTRFDATTLWCLKEAAWKALECPADVPFTDVELLFDRGGRVHAIRMGERVWRARARTRMYRGRWIAAVVRVAGGAGRRVRRRTA